MQKSTMRLATIWFILSVLSWLIGWLWRTIGDRGVIAFLLFFIGWLSMLLSIGYLSTSQNSSFGKISFGFVVVMVAGIGFKVLHLPFANALIIIGLIGLACTYVVMSYRKK